MAFFIESTFIGLWIFGWDKLPKRVHLATIWAVAIAANISSLWILIANSWMQNPVGYEVVDGRARMNDFGAIVTNENIFLQFPHVMMAGVTTGAFFVIGVSAYRLLRAKDDEEQLIFGRSLRIGLVMGLAAVVMTMTIGHFSGQFMVEKQPMKLAAAEGLWETESPAGLSFFQVGDESERDSVVNVKIPSLLSFLTYDNFDGMVPGLNDLNESYQQQYADAYGEDVDYIPPMIWMIYWSFRAMVGFGILMSLISMVGLVLWRMGRLDNAQWFLRLLPFAIFLPYVANSTGWMLTEMGRQPWIVQGLMRIEDAVSPNVTSAELAISLIGFVLVYGLLSIADFYLLWKYGSAGSVDGEMIAHGGSETAQQDLSMQEAY